MLLMMMRVLLLACLLSMGGQAQSVDPTSPAFYGLGTSMMPQSSPKATGWAAMAYLVNSSAKLYSFSEIDYSLASDHKLQTSVRTGVATLMRSFGKIGLYGIGDAGVATTGGATGGAFSGGGVLLIPLGQKTRLLIGVRVLKTALGDTQQYVEIGFGAAK